MSRGYLCQRLHGAWLTPKMNSDDSRGARRNPALHGCGIQHVSARLDIAEDKLDLLPLERMSCGDKRKRWDEPLVPHPQRPNCNIQRDGAVGDCDAVPDPQYR